MKSMKCAPVNVAERDAGVAQHTPDGSRNPKRGNAPLSGGLCQQLGTVIAASFDYTGAARSRTGPEGLTRAAEDQPNAPVRIHRTRGSAVEGRQRFRQPDKKLGPCLPRNNREGSRDGPPIRPRLAELGNLTQRHDRVYVTTDRELARACAGALDLGEGTIGGGVLYQVEVLGELDAPTCSGGGCAG